MFGREWAVWDFRSRRRMTVQGGGHQASLNRCLEHEEQRRARRDGFRNAEHSRYKDRGLARGLVDSQTCMDSATTAHGQLGAEILLPAGSLRCVSRKLAECVSLVCLWSNATVRVSSAVYKSSVKMLSEYPSNAFDGEG